MIRFNSVNPYLLTNCEGSTIAIDISARTSMIVKTVAALPGCSFADMNAKSIQITGLRSWIAGCGECLPWTHTEHHRLCGKSVSSWSSRSCLLDSFGEGSPRSRNADSDCWNVCLHRLVVKLSWRICRHSVECHLCQWRLSWRCEEGLLTSTCSHCSWYGWYYGCLWSGNESSDTFGLDSVPAMHSDLLGWRWCLIQRCLVFIPWTIFQVRSPCLCLPVLVACIFWPFAGGLRPYIQPHTLWNQSFDVVCNLLVYSEGRCP